MASMHIRRRKKERECVGAQTGEEAEPPREVYHWWLKRRGAEEEKSDGGVSVPVYVCMCVRTYRIRKDT